MDALFERIEFEKIKGEEVRTILLNASYECEQAGLNSAALEFHIKAAKIEDGKNYVIQNRTSYFTLDEYMNNNDCLICTTLQNRLQAWKRENDENETV